MISKNQYLKKKWQSLHDKNFLLFFYTSNIKAQKNRKHHRQTLQHSAKLKILPSTFQIENVSFAQGPSMGAIYAKSINFTAFESLANNQSTSLLWNGRGFSATYLKELKSIKTSKNLCLKLFDLLITQTDQKETTQNFLESSLN